MISNDESDARPGAACPSAETLVRFQRSELSRKDEDSVRFHIAGCDACAHDSLLIARTLGGEKALARELKWSRLRERWGRAFALRPIAAGLIIALAGFLVYDTIKNRALVQDHQTRAAELPFLKPVRVEKGTDSITFRWPEVEKAESYTVEIFGDSLELLWKSGKIRQGPLPLPVDVLRALKPGKPYAWTVTARLADGRTVKSKLGEFRLQ